MRCTSKTIVRAAAFAALIALALATPALARIDPVGALADHGSCAGGCIDTWRVKCPSSQTNHLEARVRDLVDGITNTFAVTTLGDSGARGLLGQADREVSGSESFVLSLPALFGRAPGATGAVHTLVLVSQASGAGGSYLLDLRCVGANGVDEVVVPRARLLRDQ